MPSKRQGSKLTKSNLKEKRASSRKVKTQKKLRKQQLHKRTRIERNLCLKRTENYRHNEVMKRRKQEDWKMSDKLLQMKDPFLIQILNYKQLKKSN